MKARNIRFPDEFLAKCAEEAEKRGISESDIIREKLGIKFDQEEDPSLPANVFDRQAELDRRKQAINPGKVDPEERTYDLEVLRAKAKDGLPMRMDEITAFDKLERIHTLEVDRQIKLDKAYPAQKYVSRPVGRPATIVTEEDLPPSRYNLLKTYPVETVNQMMDEWLNKHPEWKGKLPERTEAEESPVD